MSMLRFLASSSFVLLLAPSLALAQKSEDTLRIAVRQPVDRLDMNYQAQRDELFVLAHLYDTLILRDPDTFEYKPLLATSWRWVNPRTLELSLRRDVKFTNGEPFDARSVKASLEYISKPTSKVQYPSHSNWIEAVDVKDPYTVQIRTKKETPTAVEYLSTVIPIYHYSTYEGRATGQSPAPIGTGPYKVVKFDPGRSIDLEKNPDYFSDARGKPAISRLRIRIIPDDATQIAELLAGRLDWMWYVPNDQMDQLGRVPGIEVKRSETMRIAYLGMDAAGRTGHKAIQDLRVRQAIAHAIDREKIRANLVGGNTRVIDAPCYPAQVGCDSKDAVKYTYDLARAKKLMAEAGYPDGFSVNMVAYRFKEWSEAIMGDLAKIGIKVTLSQLPYSAAVSTLHKEQTPLFFLDWGSTSINDVSAILPYWFTGSVDDFLRDPTVKTLIEDASQTVVLEKRNDGYRKAINVITGKLGWLPMFTMTATYANSKDVTCKASADELPKFNRCNWK